MSIYCGGLHSSLSWYWAMISLKCTAPCFIWATSVSDNWIGNNCSIPLEPTTAGTLKQHSYAGWYVLSGRTCRLSSTMDSQMLETTDAMPKNVAPFALIISYALFLVFSDMLSNFSGVHWGNLWIGMLEMEAYDHAVNWESPCSPRMCAWTAVGATWQKSHSGGEWLQWVLLWADLPLPVSIASYPEKFRCQRLAVV